MISHTPVYFGRALARLLTGPFYLSPVECFDDYQRIFLNNVVPVEGALLKNGDRGILISDQAREKIYENQKFWIVPEGEAMDPASLTPDAKKAADQGQLPIKSELVVLGFSASSLESDILVPVKGIFRFQSLNEVWGEGGISFMDIESYRECFGYSTAAANAATELSEEQKAVLAADNADDIFADTEVVKQTEIKAEGYDLKAMQQQTQRTNVTVNLDNGAYNMVAIKLKPGVTMTEAQERLGRALTAAKAQTRVLTWKQVVGEISQFATLTQGALYVFVLFIFFVAIIVIMNTLSMAAIERTAEIGMMRAIGARKSFVSKMFFAETVLLSFMFGGVGILIGILASWGLGALHISLTSNEILSLLFGGDTVHPVVNGNGVVSGMIQLAIVTLIAVFYPILVARKITPLEAIAKD